MDEPVTEYRQSRFTLPPGACEIVLVRHGESAPLRPDRPFDLVDGHGDPELSAPGRWQAERVGERLASERVDAVYVTTLRRTVETAQPLLDRLGLEPRVEPDLREVHLGEWEGGLLRQKVAEGDPIAARILTEQRWDVIPGAEPQDRFRARVVAGLERIASGHPDGRVVAVSHGGVIGMALHIATGCEPFAMVAADNGSIHHLVVAPDRWVLRRYNDTGHLDGHEPPPHEPPSHRPQPHGPPPD